MKANLVPKGADRYVVGKVEKFDRKNAMLDRARWDASQADVGRKYYSPKDYKQLLEINKPGYTFEDAGFLDSAWHLEREFAQGNMGGNRLLYAWETNELNPWKRPADVKLTIDDPEKMSRHVKSVATFFGASLVGICELDRRWLYSHSYDFSAPAHPQHVPVGVPEEYKYAITIALEMDL